MINDLVFATMAGTTAAARDAMLWARSIRAFAGRYAGAAIWLLIPSNHILYVAPSSSTVGSATLTDANEGSRPMHGLNSVQMTPSAE